MKIPASVQQVNDGAGGSVWGECEMMIIAVVDWRDWLGGSASSRSSLVDGSIVLLLSRTYHLICDFHDEAHNGKGKDAGYDNSSGPFDTRQPLSGYVFWFMSPWTSLQ